MIERHLVEMAVALKQRPDTWSQLDLYPKRRKKGGFRPRRGGPRPPKPKAEHLKAEYRLGWEWMLLMPRLPGKRYLPVTAAVAELLIARGADIDAKSKYGATPLAIAIQMNKKNIADLLRKHGAKE